MHLIEQLILFLYELLLYELLLELVQTSAIELGLFTFDGKAFLLKHVLVKLLVERHALTAVIERRAEPRVTRVILFLRYQQRDGELLLILRVWSVCGE